MQDDLSNFLALLLAVQAGVGVVSSPQMAATAFAGIKIGGAVSSHYPPHGNGRTATLDLGYDRVASHNGLAMELSAMLPVFRVPGPQTDPTKNFLRVYFEPGVGYHAGAGLGGYASAKMMFVLFSDRRLKTQGDNVMSPYVELQRRLPFGDWRDGDTRVTFGVMLAVCNHCGLTSDLSVRARPSCTGRASTMC